MAGFSRMAVLLFGWSCLIQVLIVVPPVLGLMEGLTFSELLSLCKSARGGCITHPSNCNSTQDCHFLLSYSNNATSASVDFELSAVTPQSSGYIAFGISNDRNMGEDSVVQCSAHHSVTAKVFSSYNTAYKSNEPAAQDPQEGLMPGGQSVVTQDGDVMRCSFARRYSVSGNPKIFPLDGGISYYVMFARGPLSDTSGRTINKHYEYWNVVTENAYDLTALASGTRMCADIFLIVIPAVWGANIFGGF